MNDISASVTKFTLAMQPNDPNWPPMISTTEIPGLLVYERPTFADNRGFFREPLEKKDLETVFGKKIEITQWNHSQSLPQVIRGFHAEPWDKIVYIANGTVLAVIVDLRIDSPAFGKVVTFEIGEKNRKTLFLPEGMGNSFCSLGDTPSDYMYLITGYFEGKPTPAVAFNDPLLTKQFGGWPIENPIVSEKDKSYPTLKEKFGEQVDFAKFPWLQ
jgi:dTDP-4-dehydrorhamnose 3,5-epimerase